eukprot:RCo016998
METVIKDAVGETAFLRIFGSSFQVVLFSRDYGLEDSGYGRKFFPRELLASRGALWLFGWIICSWVIEWRDAGWNKAIREAEVEIWMLSLSLEVLSEVGYIKSSIADEFSEQRQQSIDELKRAALDNSRDHSAKAIIQESVRLCKKDHCDVASCPDVHTCFRAVFDDPSRRFPRTGEHPITFLPDSLDGFPRFPSPSPDDVCKFIFRKVVSLLQRPLKCIAVTPAPASVSKAPVNSSALASQPSTRSRESGVAAASSSDYTLFRVLPDGSCLFRAILRGEWAEEDVSVDRNGAGEAVDHGVATAEAVAALLLRQDVCDALCGLLSGKPIANLSRDVMELVREAVVNDGGEG